ncbi:MAG: hypothetical protein ACK5HD_05240 [Bacteroidota bacterium]
MQKKWRFVLLLLGFLTMFNLWSQERTTQFNGFGHFEYQLNNNKQINSFFTLGEHDFFVNSKLSNRISFLGEYVIRFNGASATNYLPSIERSLVKFNIKGNHSIIAGKVHTPLNYWNDVYHHGRLFLPTVDRPMAFSYLIPLHTLGLQFQGQNLGKMKFGYDFMVGNGIASTDASHSDWHTPVIASVHMKPADDLRIGLSYYYEYLPNSVYGAHSGHSAVYSHYNGELYKGPLKYELASFSLAYFGPKFEILNETTFNSTRTDSLGRANNFAQYLYIGVPVKEVHTPFVYADIIQVANNDLHTYHMGRMKAGVGYRYQFNYHLQLKLQAEYDRMLHTHDNHTVLYDPYFTLRFQLAYGF